MPGSNNEKFGKRSVSRNNSLDQSAHRKEPVFTLAVSGRLGTPGSPRKPGISPRPRMRRPSLAAELLQNHTYSRQHHDIGTRSAFERRRRISVRGLDGSPSPRFTDFGLASGGRSDLSTDLSISPQPKDSVVMEIETNISRISPKSDIATKTSSNDLSKFQPGRGNLNGANDSRDLQFQLKGATDLLKSKPKIQVPPSLNIDKLRENVKLFAKSPFGGPGMKSAEISDVFQDGFVTQDILKAKACQVAIYYDPKSLENCFISPTSSSDSCSTASPHSLLSSRAGLSTPTSTSQCLSDILASARNETNNNSLFSAKIRKKFSGMKYLKIQLSPNVTVASAITRIYDLFMHDIPNFEQATGFTRETFCQKFGLFEIQINEEDSMDSPSLHSLKLPSANTSLNQSRAQSEYFYKVERVLNLNELPVITALSWGFSNTFDTSRQYRGRPRGLSEGSISGERKRHHTLNCLCLKAMNSIERKLANFTDYQDLKLVENQNGNSEGVQDKSGYISDKFTHITDVLGSVDITSSKRLENQSLEKLERRKRVLNTEEERLVEQITSRYKKMRKYLGSISK